MDSLIQSVTEEKYEIKMCVEEAAIIIQSEADPKPTCTVTLTSPVMRDEVEGGMESQNKNIFVNICILTFQLCILYEEHY